MQKITQYMLILSVCLSMATMANNQLDVSPQELDSLRTLLAEEKILVNPSDAQGNQRFGNAVSVFGNRALVGASRDSMFANSAGSAYVFEFIGNQWVQTQKLIGDDTTTNDGFGYSVSLYEDRLMVGAYAKVIDGISQAGAVYVFEYLGGVWEQTDRLTANTPLLAAQFGFSVSLFGDKVLVGAPNNGQGLVHVFVFDEKKLQWFSSTTLSANDGGIGDRFGYSVSLYQNRGLVGANQSQSGDSGAAYVFESLINSQQTKLTASDSEAQDGFGVSVSQFGNRVVVGAHKDDVNDVSNTGSVYVYDLDEVNELWLETEKLTANDAAAGDEFGVAVSLHGDRVLIGAWNDDDNGINSGSAYLFDFDGAFWNQTNKLIASDGNSVDEFGSAVNLTADWAIIGVTGNDDNGSSAGAAYAYREDIIFFDGFE